MTFSLEQIQEDVLAYMDAQLAQPVIEQAVPDAQSVRRTSSGRIEPYVAIQFGDILGGATRSMAGVRGDDFVLPIYVQSLAGNAKDARRISNKITNVFLGETFPWAGSVRKRPGGALLPVVASNGATECYLYPTSFGLLIELANY